MVSVQRPPHTFHIPLVDINRMLLGRSGGPLGNAQIIPMDPQTDSDGQHYIPLYYHFPFGSSDSINDYSALVKPFRKLLEEGKPIGKTAFLFYLENNSYFVLGSFAFTNRTIFFPGLTFSRIVHTPDGRDLSLDEKANNIAHFTLESNFIDWHIKPVQKEIRYPTQRTRKVNDDVFLWFVMGIPDVTKLEPMPKTQEYVLTAPRHSDLDRRQRIMLESVDGSIFPVTEMVHNPESPYFLNFEFFVSNRKAKELILPDGLFVVPPPSSKLEKSDQGMRSKIIDDFSLKESISICVRTSKIRGSIIYDAVYYSGGFYEYAY